MSRLPSIVVGQHGELPVLLHANHAAIAVLVDGEASLLVEREPVGTGLAVFADIHAAVAALGHEDRELTVLRPAIDQVVVGIAEEKIAVVSSCADPDGAFGKQESAGKLFDLRVRRNDLVERRIFPDDLRWVSLIATFGDL